MSAIDHSSPGSTIPKRVKRRKPVISAMLMADIFKWKLTLLLILGGPRKRKTSKPSLLPPKEYWNIIKRLNADLIPVRTFIWSS